MSDEASPMKPPKPAGKPNMPTQKTQLAGSLQHEQHSASHANSILQCPLCEVPYDTTDHEPKLLPCHHSFCISCLRELTSGRQQVRCPDRQCRQKCTLKDGAVESLQTNFYVTQMQALVINPNPTLNASRAPVKRTNEQSQEGSTGTSCEKHLSQPLLFYCTTCMVPICMNCTVIDHDKNQGHQITDIATVVKSNQDIIKSKLQLADTSLESYAKTLNTLKTEMSNLENVKTKALGDLEETFNQLKCKLDQRKLELVNKAEEIYNDRRQKLITQGQSIKEHSSNLTALRHEMTAKLQHNDINNAVSLSQSLNPLSSLDRLCAHALNQVTTDDSHIRFQMEHGLHEYLLSIRSLGAVLCDSGLPTQVTVDHASAASLVACVQSELKIIVHDLNGKALNDIPLCARVHYTSHPGYAKPLQLDLKNSGDGCYTVPFRPPFHGELNLQILFNNQPIWGADTTLQVHANNPLLVIGKEGTAQGELRHPTSVAVSASNDIYIADMGNKRIQIFDDQGRFIQSFAVGGSKSTTYDLAINHASSELICSKVGPNDSGLTVGNTLRIFGLRGEKLQNICNPEMQRSMFMCVNTKGQILATDSAQHCLYFYSKEGVPIKKLGSLGERQNQFNFPSAIATGKEDSILVSDTRNHRVQIFNKSGKFMRQIGPVIAELGKGESLQSPRGIAADSSHILIADTLNRILVFTWDLKLVGVIGSEDSPIREPYNIAVTMDQQHVLVTDFQNNCVKKYRFI